MHINNHAKYRPSVSLLRMLQAVEVKMLSLYAESSCISELSTVDTGARKLCLTPIM
jgi:hypothetical protein